MIAVISDSHIPGRAAEIPEEFIDIIEKSDITVHCGDFETREVYEKLENKAEELIAVKGNCDRFELPNSKKFNHKNIEFGVYHGTGINPRGDHETLTKIAEEDMETKVLIHGHTHQQEAVKKSDKILLNPGSCTGVGGGSSEPGNPKMMIVNKDQEQIKAELLELENREIKKHIKKFKQ